MKNILNIILSFSLFSMLFCIEEKNENSSLQSNDYIQSSDSFERIVPNSLPNPMNDRAKGFLLKGKVQSAITNYGNFINWDHHPAGLWGEYTYLPTTAFMAGVPGHSYSYKYEWFKFPTPGCPQSSGNYDIWCSSEAYLDPSNLYPGFSWYENGDTNYVSVVFETQSDDGVLGEKLLSPNILDIPTCVYPDNPSKKWSDYWSSYSGCISNVLLEEISCCQDSGGEWTEPSAHFQSCDFESVNQWCLEDEESLVLISLPKSDDYNVDPNNANVYGDLTNKMGVGLAYPWAVRPALNKRKSISTYDLYKYGNDQEEWTNDDVYDYYGFNVAESHFTR